MTATDPATPGRSSRDVEHLVEDNLKLARYAANTAGIWPAERYDDVLADAMFGLWDAARRWDATRARFGTFAMPRIRGAIADGRRQRDPLTRGSRQRGDLFPLSLDTQPAVQTATERLTLADVIGDPNDDMTQLLDHLEHEARRAWLAAQVAELLPRQRHVIEGLIAGRTLASIAGDLGVTESRVCQMKRQTIAQLAQMARPAA